MGRSDALRDKIQKLGAKQKLGALVKFADNPDDDVRMAVAIAMGLIPLTIPEWLLFRFSAMSLLKSALLLQPLPLTFMPSIAKNTLRSLHSPIPILMSDRLPRWHSTNLRTQSFDQITNQ